MRRTFRYGLLIHPFQQGGATAPTSRASMAVSREHFPERLISSRGDLEWPARSPDLSPCDFFLWCFLKSRVHVNRPRTLQDLKTNIQEEISNIHTCYANKSHDKRQKSVYAMYGEWETSSIRFHLQKNINKNFRHVPTL